MGPLKENWRVLMVNAYNGTGNRQQAQNEALRLRRPVCSDILQLASTKPLADRFPRPPLARLHVTSASAARIPMLYMHRRMPACGENDLARKSHQSLLWLDSTTPSARSDEQLSCA